jgi:hypothetical protein
VARRLVRLLRVTAGRQRRATGYKPRVLSRLTLVLAALTLLVSGCGSDKKETYRQDFQKVAARFQSSVAKAGAQVQSGATLQERVPALRSFKASVDRLATDLQGLDPPSELERANDDAVRHLRTLSGDLSDYQSAAAAGAQARATRIVPKLQADQTVLQKTLDELDRRAAQ